MGLLVRRFLTAITDSGRLKRGLDQGTGAFSIMIPPEAVHGLCYFQILSSVSDVSSQAELTEANNFQTPR